MRVVLLTDGKVRAPHQEADAHYRKLLSRHLPIEVVEVRGEREMARRMPESGHVVALDAGGAALDSIGWSRWLERRRLAAEDLTFVLGGPHGLAAASLERADERLSLGPQTMAHQLARVVLLEQLYRAVKILAGEPYHY